MCVTTSVTFVTFVTTNQTVPGFIVNPRPVVFSPTPGWGAFLFSNNANTIRIYDTINLKKSNHSRIGLHLGDGKVETVWFWGLRFSTVPNFCTLPQFRGWNIHEITGELGLGTIGIF